MIGTRILSINMDVVGEWIILTISNREGRIEKAYKTISKAEEEAIRWLKISVSKEK